MKSARAAAWFAVAVVLSGCAASSPRMTVLDAPLRLAARPGAARVVFVRESVDVSGTLVPVVSASGRLLGDMPSSSCFAADLEPGAQRFVTLTRPVGVLDATLVSGRTYFVRVEVRFGTRSPRIRLLPVKAEEAPRAATRLDCDPLALATEEVVDATAFLTLASERLSFVTSPPVLGPSDGLDLATGGSVAVPPP